MKNLEQYNHKIGEHTIRCYDEGGKVYIERYSIVYVKQKYLKRKVRLGCEVLGLSENPDSPQGISQHSTCEGEGEHLGKLVMFEELPEHIRKHIERRLRY